MAQHYGKGQGKTWSMEKGRWNGQSTDRSRYTWSDTETRAGFDKSRGKGIMQGKWDTTVKKGAEKGIEKGVEKGMEKGMERGNGLVQSREKGKRASVDTNKVAGKARDAEAGAVGKGKATGAATATSKKMGKEISELKLRVFELEGSGGGPTRSTPPGQTRATTRSLPGRAS